MTALVDDQTGYDLWPAVWKLLRLRILIFYSGFRHASRVRKIGIIFLGVLFLAFLGFLLFLSWAMLRFLHSPQLTSFVGDVSPFLESVPVLIIGGTFLGILLTSFGVLLQALYLAGDMDFLLTIPVPIRAVFITKLLQAILPNFSLICLFALPVLFGLGISGEYSFLYYPLVPVVLGALALAAAGISSLLVMLIVRIFPARRVAELLGFIGAVTSFVCSQSGQLANFGNFSQEQAGDAFRYVTRLNVPWSPLAWAGRGLVDLGEGRWLTGGGLLLLSLLLAGLAFGLALITAERLYYTGWASMQGIRRKKKTARAAYPGRAKTFVALTERIIPGAIRALLVKDYYVLRRDLRNMSQLVTPLIFGIVYAVMFLRSGGQPPAGRGEAPAIFMELMKNMMVYGNVGISLFVGWMLLGRLAGMGFSQEGKGYWILKTAPVRVSQLIAAKFLVAYLPALFLGWLFLLAISLLQKSLLTLWFTLPVVALSIAGITGLNLTFGITGANLNWQDPRHMTKGSSGCLGALSSMVFLLAGMVLFFGPPLGLPLLGLAPVMGQLAGILLGGVFSLGCAFVPLWFVRGRVLLLGEG